MKRSGAGLYVMENEESGYSPLLTSPTTEDVSFMLPSNGVA